MGAGYWLRPSRYSIGALQLFGQNRNDRIGAPIDRKGTCCCGLCKWELGDGSETGGLDVR
jgi:hypothetical protein